MGWDDAVSLIKKSPLAERYRARKMYWRSFNTTGEWELMELPTYVPRHKLAIDVGGNVGEYSYHLKRLARSVVTFEPNPAYAERLRRSGLGKRLIEVALSDQAGSAELRIPYRDGREDAGMGSLEAGAVPDGVLARTINVPIHRLDDYDFVN